MGLARSAWDALVNYFTSGMAVARVAGCLFGSALMLIAILTFGGVGLNVYKVEDTAHYSDAHDHTTLSRQYDSSHEYDSRYYYAFPMTFFVLALLTFSFHLCVRFFEIDKADRKTRVGVGCIIVFNIMLGISALFVFFGALVVGSFGFQTADNHVSSTSGFQGAMAVAWTCTFLWFVTTMLVVSL